MECCALSKQKEGSSSLRRGLKARHMTMISLGGSIGTGLFLASGGAIHSAGPGGALLAYALIGVMVYFLMTSLGEMATYMPVSGTFSTYATRFVDPSLGFALGWNYWYNWAITIAAELSAATLIMKFWFPNSPSILWSALFLLLMLGLNLLSVKGYGESEYWFAMIKIITVIIFIAIGLLMVIGIWNGQAVGISNLTDNPFPAGSLATLGVFMAAGFSFQGTELIGVTAGESENPRENIPRAIRSIFWRILLFYILAILLIGMLIPYSNEQLASGDISTSPFTIIFEKAGLAVAASIMNAVILTSVLSAGNSGMYASTRMLWVLAKEGKAPRILARLNERGVPVASLIATGALGMLAFLASFFGDGVVYVWLLNASGMSGFIVWLGIAISHYRFRKAYIYQGRKLEDLAYLAKWFPFGPILAMLLCIVVIGGQFIGALHDGRIDWAYIIASYVGIPLFLAIFIGHKWKHRTRMLTLAECELEPEE
ncbi:amino acid permease [Paenibacillus sp. LHD-38]|uniref:amino acid permease n=1 Tax=Paenibacillus sp. LHD-38 TaxID=3072143 RepID=UPI00280FF54D|nr:amino acid permease [Paenibacillus sp. LHD-38]MDQ8734909.1 amino acid permease [Paenibacillus sp. LHD-38]